MAVYGSQINRWDELEVTKEELDNLTDCLKKEEFRELLFEYAEEVTNPENKKLYESEIIQLEKERGVDITFINPEPGYVIKTSVDGSKKCFVNISKSSTVAKPSSQPTYENGNKGLQWSIPYTLAPPRDDLDKKNSRCIVFDVVFHPDTLHLASKNTKFRETVNETALDGVEKNFGVKLDRNNIKFPKINFKGISQPTVIRKKSEKKSETSLDIEPEIYQKLMSSYDQSRAQQQKQHQQVNNPEKKPERLTPATKYYKGNNTEIVDSEKSGYTIPKFLIKHQNNIEIEDFGNHKNAKLLSAIPNKLIIVVDLPLLKTANDASLDVQERLILVKSDKPAKYQLQLPLPYSVDPDNGNAKFDTQSKKLTITLPVVRGTVPLSIENHCKEDSGVESDHGSPLNDFQDEIRDDEPLIEIIGDKDHESAFSECEDTALRTNENNDDDDDDEKLEKKEEKGDDGEMINSFMNNDIRYSLPPFTFNLFDNTLALTIHLKNVDPASVQYRTLSKNSGFHILLTSVGAGFFPVYYSLCFKTGENSVVEGSMTVEPWDNNVVFTVSLENDYQLVNYYVGIDEGIMELKELQNSISLKNKLNKLMIRPQTETEKKIEVVAEGDDIVINVTSSNQLDSDDEVEREYTDSSPCDDHRSISESSGDELNNIHGTAGRSKGILKSRRNYGFTRSVSESCVDDSIMLASSMDFHSNSIPEINSESCGSSLKKTVRFNDVVARQLYRSNSSILGQRKKNQRKLRNKKRAHDRRTSESENSESDDRAEKYKVSHKDDSEEGGDTHENVKPILNQDKSMAYKTSEHIDIENQKKYNARLNKRNSSDSMNRTSWDNDHENDTNVVKEVFKNDLIFDLDI